MSKFIEILLVISLVIGILVLITFIEKNYNQKECSLQLIIEKCYYQSQTRTELDFCIEKEKRNKGINFYERISY